MGSCTFIALAVTEYDWKFAGVTCIIRNMTCIICWDLSFCGQIQAIYGHFEFMSVQLRFWSWTSHHSLVQRGSGWGARAIVEGGQWVCACVGGVMVTVCPVSWPLSCSEGLLADSGMTSPGGPFVPLFGSVEILHTKAAWRSYLQIWVDAALLKIPNKIKP